MRIGTVAGARQALNGELTYLGEGCFREAYIDYETDTVYKIENEDGIEWAANSSEWATYCNRDFLILPSNVRIVPMRMLTVDNMPIIAARFIRGVAMGDCYCVPEFLEPDHAEVCLSDDIAIELANAGIDTAHGNIIYDGTTYWVVDAQ